MDILDEISPRVKIYEEESRNKKNEYNSKTNIMKYYFNTTLEGIWPDNWKGLTEELKEGLVIMTRYWY